MEPILRGHRVLIIGQNGSGKSVLASRIASSWSRVLVYDPKIDRNAVIPNAHVAYGVRDALRALPGRVIYRPLPSEQDDVAGAFDQLVRKVWLAGGGHGIVVHESEDIAPSSGARRWLRTAIKQGREVGDSSVPMVFLTQRPVWIDRLLRSEPAHVFLFRLLDPDDFEHAAKLLGRRAKDLEPIRHPHGFYHRGPSGEVRQEDPLIIRRDPPGVR